MAISQIQNKMSFNKFKEYCNALTKEQKECIKKFIRSHKQFRKNHTDKNYHMFMKRWNKCLSEGITEEFLDSVSFMLLGTLG